MQISSACAAPRSPSLDALVPLAEHPEIVATATKLAAYHARLADAKLRGDRARHAAQKPKPTRTPQERAELLVQGGVIPSADPAAEVMAAAEEVQVLMLAICKETENRQEVASRLSYEASLKFRDRHVAAFRQLDGVMSSTHAALAELVGIDQSLREAGYTPNSTALPSHIPANIWKLGDPDQPGGQAWMFRQWFKRAFGAGA